MKDNKLVLTAIIATVEQDKRYLKQCLLTLSRSVKYTGWNLKVIVIANGTSLSQIDYLNTPVTIIESERNEGFGKAINKGLKLAKSQWCIILAPDTRARLTTINDLVKFIPLKKVAILAPKVIKPNGQLDKTILSFTTLWTIFTEQSYLYKLFPIVFRNTYSDYSLYEKSGYVHAIASTFWLVNRKIIKLIGDFDERFFLFHDDLDLCKRIRTNGYKIIFEPKASITHLGHKSVSSQLGGKLLADSYYIYLSKYFSTLYVFICILFLFIGSLIRFAYWFLLAKTYSYGKYKSENKVIFHLSFLAQCLSLLKRIVYSYRPYPVNAHL